MVSRALRARSAVALYASPALLAITLFTAYVPSLRAGFYGLDDVWLFRDNPFLDPPRLAGLKSIWFDFSVATRLLLGAEYLPVRDTASWLAVGASSMSATWLRFELLSLYVVAVLMFRAALLGSVRDRSVAELAAWLFALHPVHVESVAWLSGSKDVLALFFLSAGLAAYAWRRPSYGWSVPLLFALAYFSKSAAVVGPALLVISDLLASRKVATRVVVTTALLAVAATIIHLKIGASVQMVSAPYGGSRWATFWTMGTVWLRYLGIAVWPPALSLFHHVPVIAHPSATSVLGYALLVLWAAAGAATWRRGNPLVLAAFLLWIVPLAPVSQIVFPLQNQMADRYLLLSVAGPCLLFSAACAPRTIAPPRGPSRWQRVAGAVTATAAILALLFSTFTRSEVFADETRLYLDAFRKEPDHPGAAYQIGWLLESFARPAAAERWYRRALDAPSTQRARAMAASNLARILARRGDLAAAESVLETARRSFPDDPQLLGNLAEVVLRRGRDADARRLFDELVRRFPNYAPGRKRFELHYGSAAPTP